MSDKPSRLILGPFNRVEGDLEVRLDIAGDHVEGARVTSPLYRGFEAMLVGRPAADALTYARAFAAFVRCRKAWRLRGPWRVCAPPGCSGNCRLPTGNMRLIWSMR
jgi:hypothetical protein